MYNVANMKTKEDIQASLAGLKETLKREYGVTEIGLFGSFLRGEQQPESDVDILVAFERPMGLFEFVGLKHYLSDVLGVQVDLVMKKALRPAIGDRILREVIYV
jgi:predicted nucleotidyltransferase